MITYPLILLDREWTEKIGFVITIMKPKIHFDNERLIGNQELIGSEFCDSKGNVYVLKDIELGERHQNLWQKLFDKEKFKVWGSYRFRQVNRKIDLAELKELAIELMKIETIEAAHEEYATIIKNSNTHEYVIGSFGVGVQE